MLFMLPGLVRGLSFLDPKVDQSQYIIAWTTTMLLVLALFVIACLDVLLTVADQRRRLNEEMIDAARNLGAALERGRSSNGDDTGA
jgi:ABC-type Fe3+ transport system permease subunit